MRRSVWRRTMQDSYQNEPLSSNFVRPGCLLHACICTKILNRSLSFGGSGMTSALTAGTSVRLDPNAGWRTLSSRNGQARLDERAGQRRPDPPFSPHAGAPRRRPAAPLAAHRQVRLDLGPCWVILYRRLTAGDPRHLIIVDDLPPECWISTGSGGRLHALCSVPIRGLAELWR